MPGVVVPDGVVQGENPVSIQGVQDILIRQHQLFFMRLHITENLLLRDAVPAFLQVYEQDAGIIIGRFGPQPQAVDVAGQLRPADVGRRCEQTPLQRHLPEGAQRIDHQDIRVEIEDFVQLRGQQPGRQKPVIHLLGVLLHDRRPSKEGILHGHRVKTISHPLTQPPHRFQGRRRDAAVQQINLHRIAGVIPVNGCQQYLKLGNVVLVQGNKQSDRVHRQLLLISGKGFFLE